MSVFAGAGGKAGGNKKVQQNQELGPKFAAVKVWVSNFSNLRSEV